ncbi:MAG TPA: FHA domain-containing protein [Polyangiaceae bacterium]|nr:FHA domain-containing protein [Polyangiaceae bacterium]
MPFRLRYLSHDLELPIGDFIIGRSDECQLSLDDPLVSRRHAVLRVRADGVSLEDLGSRNGVMLNGTKIHGEHDLDPGDRVGIGSQEMTLQFTDERQESKGMDEQHRRAMQTLGAMSLKDIRETVETNAGQPDATSSTSKTFQSFRLLAGVADKALAMGRAEEAERILQTLLVDIQGRARDGRLSEQQVAENAARYAARLAGATGKGSWVDFVFQLYAYTRRPLPAPVIDELFNVVRKVKGVDINVLRSYLGELRQVSSGFGPTERFLMQRLEGLERLLALK